MSLHSAQVMMIQITHSDDLHETMKAALGLDDLVLNPNW